MWPSSCRLHGTLDGASWSKSKSNPAGLHHVTAGLVLSLAPHPAAPSEFIVYLRMTSGSTRKYRVGFETYDDGPPGPDSPYLVRAFHTVDLVKGRYYYPNDPARQGENFSSLLGLKEGGWVLLDATPASCANIALHHLVPGEIDLEYCNIALISLSVALFLIKFPDLILDRVQPSSAFTLPSGTLGADFFILTHRRPRDCPLLWQRVWAGSWRGIP
ncbi:hypothetical protein BJ322DRAFT_501788 [Thelephora terrestris]|uniref:Uncharacterized protein n=1 Tax=Thelephora terrestris TaxID=56493 RepID=A0A9P6H2Q6_9AGAM|nr:hypothetical protein BJ322DRAFT_501788 [Thelephora terrestris]